MMKSLLVVCALALAPLARAADPPDYAIPLEQLPADEQQRAVDAGRKDAAEAQGFRNWSAAADQLIAYSAYIAVVRTAGADLAIGIR